MTLQLHITPMERAFVRPLQTAAGTIASRKGMVLQWLQNDRCLAQGECSPLPGWSKETLEACQVQALAWVGSEAKIDTWLARLHAVDHLPALRFALESMVIQLVHHAPIGDQPWPAPERTHVRVNALVHDAQSAQQRAQEGFQVLKIKVGAAPLAEDVERVKSIRRAVGDTITLRLDANCAWSFQDAQNAIEALAPQRIALLEEPLQDLDIKALAELKKESLIPLAADERARDAASITALLQHDAVDAVVLKPTLIGGPLRTLELARLAARQGVYSIITTTLEGPVGTHMCAQVAARLPQDRAHGLSTGLLFTDTAGFPPIHRGTITIQGAL